MTINATPFVANSVLTAAQMTNLPMGFVDSSGATATTAIVGGTPLAVLTKSITIYASRKYRISASLGFQPSANSTGNSLYFTVGTLQKVFWYQGETMLANYPRVVFGSYISDAAAFGVSSGSSARTFTLYLRCGGNGALITNPDGIMGASSAEQLMWIEDIGAA